MSMRYILAAVFVLSMGIPTFVAAQQCPPGCSVGSISGQCVDAAGEFCAPVTNPPPNNNPTNPSPNTNPGTTLINPLKGGDLQTFLLNILDVVIYIGSIIVVLMLVFVGFKFVTARGEPGKLQEARGALLWTVIGALVLLGSKAIALGIKATVQALSGS